MWRVVFWYIIPFLLNSLRVATHNLIILVIPFIIDSETEGSDVALR